MQIFTGVVGSSYSMPGHIVPGLGWAGGVDATADYVVQIPADDVVVRLPLDDVSVLMPTDDDGVIL